MVNSLPELIKSISPQIPKVKQIPSKINENKSVSSYIDIKLQKHTPKKRSSKQLERKDRLLYLKDDFSYSDFSCVKIGTSGQ